MLAWPGEDRHRVGQAAGHRLVDEHRLLGFEHGQDLGQVRPAVDAFQEDDVDLLEQLVDRSTISTPSLRHGSTELLKDLHARRQMSGLPPG